MKIKFFIPENLDRNIKATVHKSGKMGFTIEAAKKLELNTQKGLLIGVNEEDAMDKNLYVLVNATKDKNTFPILKAGAYHYVNTKPLFDSLKIDYLNKNISFEITEEEVENNKMYIFKAKQKERQIK